MSIKTLRDYSKEVAQIRHALRIGASEQEWKDCIKALSQPVRFECPLGEALGSLSGFAWVWKMRGLLIPEPIVQVDKLNAQGLEGKVSIPCTLYDALFYAMQADERRVQIRTGVQS